MTVSYQFLLHCVNPFNGISSEVHRSNTQTNANSADCRRFIDVLFVYWNHSVVALYGIVNHHTQPIYYDTIWRAGLCITHQNVIQTSEPWWA